MEPCLNVMFSRMLWFYSCTVEEAEDKRQRCFLFHFVVSTHTLAALWWLHRECFHSFLPADGFLHLFDVPCILDLLPSIHVTAWRVSSLWSSFLLCFVVIMRETHTHTLTCFLTRKCSICSCWQRQPITFAPMSDYFLCPDIFLRFVSDICIFSSYAFIQLYGGEGPLQWLTTYPVTWWAVASLEVVVWGQSDARPKPSLDKTVVLCRNGDHAGPNPL